MNDRIVPDTYPALRLRESTCPAVQYLPICDAVQDVLTRADAKTCPDKVQALDNGLFETTMPICPLAYCLK
jgi:uncharacterized protein (DUF427 family)